LQFMSPLIYILYYYIVWLDIKQHFFLLWYGGEREWVSENVCEWVRERERERVWVCVCACVVWILGLWLRFSQFSSVPTSKCQYSPLNQSKLLMALLNKVQTKQTNDTVVNTSISNYKVPDLLNSTGSPVCDHNVHHVLLLAFYVL
jgi:hypothetical protein